MGRRIAANRAGTDLIRARSKNFLSRRSLKEFGDQWPVVKGVIDLGEGTARDHKVNKVRIADSEESGNMLLEWPQFEFPALGRHRETMLGRPCGMASILRQKLVLLNHGGHGQLAVGAAVFDANHAAFALHADTFGERDLRRQG